jgi:hypothetical protein
MEKVQKNSVNSVQHISSESFQVCGNMYSFDWVRTSVNVYVEYCTACIMAASSSFASNVHSGHIFQLWHHNP